MRKVGGVRRIAGRNLEMKYLCEIGNEVSEKTENLADLTSARPK